MDRTEVIQAIVDATKAEEYLEIGVRSGDNFVPMRVRHKTGVDPCMDFDPAKPLGAAAVQEPQGASDEVELCECTSDSYYAGLDAQRRFDVIFIDGLHTHEQSLRDALNSLEHLEDGGVIVLHDCNPPNEAAAHPAPSLEAACDLQLPGWTGEWCGDVWKTACFLRSQRHDLEMFVLNCDYGLGVIAKGEARNPLFLETSELEAMTYSDLSQNRERFLGLEDPAFLTEFLSRY
jgi:hypothetical protein